MSLINGWNGPFNPNNAINRGANTGQQVANLAHGASNGNMFDMMKLMTSDIQYTTQENGKFSINGGLAYAMESLKGIDKNHDGIVSTQEAGPMGRIIDLNNDGKISASENLAYTMYQDAAGNMDGKVTAQERMQADQAMMADPGRARAQMQKLNQGHNLAGREQQMTQQNQQNQQMHPMMQMMMMFMQTIMQMFGMGNQQNQQNSFGFPQASASANAGGSFASASASSSGMGQQPDWLSGIFNKI